MNCRHLSPRGWRHHLPRQRGHWVCDRGRGVVTPCGPLCNESCDAYQEPGTTGPQEDTTMPANKRIGWTLPASETVEGAPSDLTLEQWARAEKDAGRAGDAMRLIGVTGATFYTRLKQVQPQAAAPAKPAAPQRTEDEPCAGCRHDGLPLTDEPCHSCSALDPDETADHYELATQPAVETKAPVRETKAPARETKRRPRGTAKPRAAATAPKPETERPAPDLPREAPGSGRPLVGEEIGPTPYSGEAAIGGAPQEDDGAADLPEETRAGSDDGRQGGFKLEAPAAALLSFVQRAGMEREAAMYCAGWADRGREPA